jgi:uncharacterized protein YneF (UPF0154 family)
MDTIIWIIIIIVSVIIFALSLLISVTALHKKFIENPLKKKGSIDI